MEIEAVLDGRRERDVFTAQALGLDLNVNLKRPVLFLGSVYSPSSSLIPLWTRLFVCLFAWTREAAFFRLGSSQFSLKIRRNVHKTSKNPLDSLIIIS